MSPVHACSVARVRKAKYRDRLAADEVVDDLLALALAAASRSSSLSRSTLRVERSRESAVGGEDDDRGARRCSRGSVVSTWSTFEYVATAETARVTARAYGADAATRACAFWMREAEMSSMARVIFLVVWADRIFCR